MDKVEQDYWNAGGKDTTKKAHEFGYVPSGPTLKSLAQGSNTYKGMLVFQVAQSGTPDISNGGISSEHDRYLLMGAGVPEETHTLDASRVLVLLKSSDGTLYAEPYLEQKVGKSMKFGGTFVWNNKNFGKKINPYPVPVNDRA